MVLPQEGVLPFKNIRYANTSSEEEYVQVVVEYEEENQTKSGNAYANPQPVAPVANGQHVFREEPQPMLPAGALITKVTISWSTEGPEVVTTLEIPLATPTADIHMLMVQQGMFNSDAALFGPDATLLGAAATGNVYDG